MRIDAGLVLDRLHATTAVPTRALEDSSHRETSAAPSELAGDRASNAACSELAEGLKWIWICLGRESGLPVEAAALEVCADHGVSL